MKEGFAARALRALFVAALLGQSQCGQETATDRAADDTALMEAVKVGDVAQVKALLGKGAHVDTRDLQGMTVLHVAAFQGREAIAEALIEKGADVNRPDSSGHRPLHMAAEQGLTDMARLLISKGADINAKDGLGRTPLDTAEKYGHKETAEALRKHGGKSGEQNTGGAAEPTYQDAESIAEAVFPKKPGHFANTNAHEVAPPALRKDINAPVFGEGITALHGAVLTGSKFNVEFILGMKANANAKEAHGLTPLHLAAAKGYQDIADLLIRHGADLEAKESLLGASPIFLAIQKGNRDFAELLIAHGANVNAAEIGGLTPLHRAAERNDRKLAEVLIRKGADVNARDKNGKTPVDRAIDKDHTGMVEFLYKHDGRSSLELD